MFRSTKLRKAAKGERCTLNIVGICNYNEEKTVLAHLPDESHGMAQKSSDLSSCFACSACHDAVDHRKHSEWSEDSWCEFQNHKEWYMRRAMVRTWKRMFELGIWREC